ncbi:serine/threonine-protein kinase NIM1-like isoform X2 [Cimex lectularius]|uniref:non-specific serine/threonine protein kinase n=1 Tax=Cimex lectularius TaxID=79782 RepID=A0A8I6SD23_CIMLE|nr:serine/threonine-protein kinase NIM1-like isoform X2 [Cimex lectularius]XP_014261617.1 serine/threonine-protein kinase NIM1-like isoform X2 [Cimex lectularius]XP_014261618.1 serine/threonine-protein kinase NIM1-like isoform X2 [Cimex lectularius]
MPVDKGPPLHFNNNTQRSLYDKSVHNLHHDQKWQQETTLGKRVALYKLQGELGRGNFSIVKLGVHELTKERVAVKIMDKSKLTPKARKMLVREIASMEAVHHKNIIRLFEVVETFSKLHLVMEFVNGGELYQKLLTEGKMKETDAKQTFAQILSAVKHLHERNIIHRDIKAENVFCGPRGIVKLGDFGFSTRASGSEELKTFCGSPPYAAPELFRDESYSGRPVDIWALGVLLFFMTTGHMPFPADSIAGLKRSILLGVITAPAHLSLPCRTLIRGILRQTPKDRFSLDQIAESEWMNGHSINGGTCEKYILSPTLGVPMEKLSQEEKTAREKLEALGITQSMLEHEMIQGARSTVIASYRIVIHRLQCIAQLPPIQPVKPQKSRACSIL